MADNKKTPQDNKIKKAKSEAKASDQANNEHDSDELYYDNTAGTIFSADSEAETGSTKAAQKTSKKQQKQTDSGKTGKKKPVLFIIIAVVVVAALVGVFFLVKNNMPSVGSTESTYPTDENGQQYATDLKGNKIDSVKDKDGNIVSAGVEELISHVPADIKEVKVKNDNGSFELLSETPTETSTDKSGKKVTTTQKTQYTLKGYEDAPLASGMPDAVANDAAAVTTTNIVDINGKNIEEYGLDKPRATVTVTFANKNKRTITIGSEAPDSAGTYIMVDGDKAIYLVANDSVDSFLYKPMTFLDTSVTTAAEKSSNGTPETATISGTNFKDTLEFKANDDTTVNTAHYKMTAPVNCFVNVTNGSTVLESLRSITADEVIAYKPNDDTMSKYGLSTSNPYAKIAAKFGDGTITLYSSKPKTEKTEATTEAATEALEDGSSSTTETTTEYAYIYNPSTNIIYKIVTTKVPWVNTSFEDMVFEYVIKADEASIKTIEVTADGKTSKFDLSTETKKDKDGNKTKSTTVKSGKNTIETSKFDIFFQNLESATVANVKTSNVSTSADLTVKITYNTDKEPDTYTFYKGETGKYNFSIDGKIILGNVFDTYVNKIIEDAPKLAKGESITAI